MKKVVNLIIFKVGFEVLASLEVDNQTIFDIEKFKYMLAIYNNVSLDSIDVSFQQKEVRETLGESFISVTGKLCFHNDRWDAEIIEGFSFVDWLDLKTEEGINTIIDYKFLNKEDELVKFN